MLRERGAHPRQPTRWARHAGRKSERKGGGDSGERARGGGGHGRCRGCQHGVLRSHFEAEDRILSTSQTVTAEGALDLSIATSIFRVVVATSSSVLPTSRLVLVSSAESDANHRRRVQRTQTLRVQVFQQCASAYGDRSSAISRPWTYQLNFGNDGDSKPNRDPRKVICTVVVVLFLSGVSCAAVRGTRAAEGVDDDVDAAETFEDGVGHGLASLCRHQVCSDIANAVRRCIGNGTRRSDYRHAVMRTLRPASSGLKFTG